MLKASMGPRQTLFILHKTDTTSLARHACREKKKFGPGRPRHRFCVKRALILVPSSRSCRNFFHKPGRRYLN